MPQPAHQLDISTAGPVIAEYGPRSIFTRLIGRGVLALAAIGYGLAIPSVDEAMFLILLGLFMGAVAIANALRDYRDRANRLRVCERGLVSDTRDGAGMLRWEAIASLNVQVTPMFSGLLYTYTIIDRDDYSIRFNQGVKNHDELFEQIKDRALPHILKRVAAALARGEEIAFGQFTLSGDGIAHRNAALLWSEVGEVKVAYRQVEIRKRGQRRLWRRVSVNRVPNADALVALAEKRAAEALA